MTTKVDDTQIWPLGSACTHGHALVGGHTCPSLTSTSPEVWKLLTNNVLWFHLIWDLRKLSFRRWNYFMLWSQALYASLLCSGLGTAHHFGVRPVILKLLQCAGSPGSAEPPVACLFLVVPMVTVRSSHVWVKIYQPIPCPCREFCCQRILKMGCNRSR